MKKKTPEISIVIVHYKVKKELFSAIESVYISEIIVPYEIIVVDNDEEKTIKKELLQKFPNIIYIPNEKNTGWGEGTNVGMKYARGNYLYFLNPDTYVYKHAITRQYEFLKNHKKAGIVSSLLIDKNGNPYALQGTEKLTPLSAIFAISIINKYFPNNPVSKRFWLKNWEKKENKQIDVVPLSSAIIKKDIFVKTGGFDKNFFLYFEEYDLSRKVKKLGYTNYIIVNAHVKHLWGVSSEKRNDIQKIFSQSRFYYFQKYYGRFVATIVESILSFTLFDALLIPILLLGTFLRFFNLSKDMMFIGDFGWFYISAREFLLNGVIPLVGITASHTWLHQGPLWTYLLSIALLLGKFNPLSGGYLSVTIGVITIAIIYVITTKIFNKKIGIIAALLYATSPLIIIHSRMPYHTSPIPLFVMMFFYTTYRWIKGEIKYVPFVILSLSLLYNLELASISLFGYVFILLIFGLIKRKTWTTQLANKRIIVLTCLFFLIPMLPILIYDTSHGFPQTIVFPGWIGYKVLQALHIIPTSSNQLSSSWNEIITFSLSMTQRLVFLPHMIVALLLLLISIATVVYETVKGKREEYILLFSSFVALTVGFIIAKTPSEAYIPFFFPFIVLFEAIFFAMLMKKRSVSLFVTACILLLQCINIYSLLFQNYLMDIPGGYGISYQKRLDTAEQIVKESKGKPYILRGQGEGSQFESFTDNYIYLTWWLGNPPSNQTKKNIFTLTETSTKVSLKKTYH